MNRLRSGWKNAAKSIRYFIPLPPATPAGRKSRALDTIPAKLGNQGYDILTDRYVYFANAINKLALAFADYVLMRGMTNPEENYEDILDHYCAGFGTAAEDIKQFYEYWRKNWENRIIPQLPKVLEVGRFKNFARGLMWGEAVNCFKDSDFDNTDKILDAALAKDLPSETRAFISQLKTANTEGRLVLDILRNKTPEKSRKLYDFRKANKLPTVPYGEKKWGDPCGVKNLGLLGEYDAPYRKMPVVWSFKLDPADVRQCRKI